MSGPTYWRVHNGALVQAPASDGYEALFEKGADGSQHEGLYLTLYAIGEYTADTWMTEAEAKAFAASVRGMTFEQIKGRALHAAPARVEPPKGGFRAGHTCEACGHLAFAPENGNPVQWSCVVCDLRVARRIDFDVIAGLKAEVEALKRPVFKNLKQLDFEPLPAPPCEPVTTHHDTGACRSAQLLRRRLRRIQLQRAETALDEIRLRAERAEETARELTYLRGMEVELRRHVGATMAKLDARDKEIVGLKEELRMANLQTDTALGHCDTVRALAAKAERERDGAEAWAGQLKTALDEMRLRAERAEAIKSDLAVEMGKISDLARKRTVHIPAGGTWVEAIEDQLNRRDAEIAKLKAEAEAQRLREKFRLTDDLETAKARLQSIERPRG